MENKDKAIDFEHKKKEIEKRKKEEEESRKQEFEKKQFKRGILADIEKRRIYNAAKSEGIVDEDITWTETTFQRVEKIHNKLRSLVKKLNRIIRVLLCLVISLAVVFGAYSWYMHYSLSKQKETNKELEQTVATEKKKEAFIDQLRKFNYYKQDEFIKFLEKNKLKYTIEEGNNARFYHVEKGDTEYVVKFDHIRKECEILTKVNP